MRRVNRKGVITTVARIGETFGPTDIAVDAAGNLYIAEPGRYADSRVRRVNRKGVSTTVLSSFSRGVGWIARGLAVDAAGNLYIAQSGRVRRVNRKGVITTVAGTGG